MDDLVEKLRAERLSLEEKIAVSQHRMGEIDQFLALFEKLTGKTVRSPAVEKSEPVTPAVRDEPPDSEAERPWRVHITPSRSSTAPAGNAEIQASLRERIVKSVRDILSDGRRRTTRELVEMLGARGIRMNTSDPIANLSTYLSREKAVFTSDVAKGGWGLVDTPLFSQVFNWADNINGTFVGSGFGTGLGNMQNSCGLMHFYEPMKFASAGDSISFSTSAATDFMAPAQGSLVGGYASPADWWSPAAPTGLPALTYASPFAKKGGAR